MKICPFLLKSASSKPSISSYEQKECVEDSCMFWNNYCVIREGLIAVQNIKNETKKNEPKKTTTRKK